MGLELYVQSKVDALIQILQDAETSPSATLESCKKMYHSHAKHCINKDTGLVTVVVGEEETHLEFGYDETSSFDPMDLNCKDSVEKDLVNLAKSMAVGKGSILRSPNVSEKAVRLLGVFLGRRISIVSLPHDGEGMEEGLELIKAGLKCPEDLLCLKRPLQMNGCKHVSDTNLYQILLTQTTTVKHVSKQDSKVHDRIIFLEPHDSTFGLGGDFRIIRGGSERDRTGHMQRCLTALGLQGSEAEDLSKSFHEIEKMQKEVYKTNKGKRLGESEPYKKTRAYKDIKEVFLYGDVKMAEIQADLHNKFGTTMVPEPWLRDVAASVLHRPADPKYFDPKLKNACHQRDLELTEAFKKQSASLLRILASSRDAIAVVGPRLSGKSTLVDVCSAALNHEVHHFSSVMLNKDALDSRRGFETFVNSLARGRGSRHKDVLIVLHGPLESLESAEFATRLVRNRRNLLISGHLMINVRKMRILVEIDENDEGSEWLEHFYVVRTTFEALPWQALLKSMIKMLGIKPNDNADNNAEMTQIVTEEISRHVEMFQRCRSALVEVQDNPEIKHLNVNNFLLLLKASNVYSSKSREECREIMLFAGLFCFSQDLDQKQKDKLENRAREQLDCFNVPVQESLYEYIYEDGKWVEYQEFINEKENKSALLPLFAKMAKISHILLEKNISIDIFGSEGVGKSNFMSYLAERFSETPNGDENKTKVEGGEAATCLQFKVTFGTTAGSIVDCLEKGSLSGGGVERLSGEELRSPCSGGAFKLFVDDVSDAGGDQVWHAVNFLGQRRRWILGGKQVRRERVVVRTVRKFWF